MYFNRFPGSYVGLGDAWKDEPWHSYALAFIWEKDQTGRSLIIYDVDAILKEEAQQIIDAGELYNDFLLSWEAYIVKAKSHLSAGVDQKDAKQDQKILTT